MAGITVHDLPAPPPGKTGWPWSEGSPSMAESMPNGSPWPKISIVIPSFNQKPFIEEAIRSVLLQGYPNSECIIIDGGSSDGSVEIIQEYEPWLAYWVSEKDRNQCHAINKGWRKATGDIWAWLNSDDSYLPGAFGKAAAALLEDPSISLVYGSALFVDSQSRPTNRYEGRRLAPGTKKMRFWKGWPVPQPTVFFLKQLVSRFGPLNEEYSYSLDYEWIIRISRHIQVTCLSDNLATYRLHGDSKTGDWEKNKWLFHRECARANRKYAPIRSPRSWPLWLGMWSYYLKETIRNKVRSVMR